jgi:mycothiol synthase
MTSPVLEKTVTLPPGYILRPMTMDDAEAVVRVETAASQKRGDNEHYDPEETRRAWSEPEFELAKSSRALIAPDGEFVGLVTVWDTGSNPVHPFVGWEIMPRPDRHELALALLSWGGERAKEALDRCPPEARVSWKTGILAGYQLDLDIMRAAGLTPIRYFNRMLIEMQDEPEPLALPDGMSIRTFNYPDELPTLAAAQNEAWRDHFGYTEHPMDEILKDWRHWLETDKVFDPALWYLAIDDQSGEIAGMVLTRLESHEDPAVSYVNIVATRRPWRGRGIAKVLLRHSFREFWQRGRKLVSLYVDDSSPTGANRLYEQIGMHVSRQYIQHEKEIRPGVELANV